MLSGSGCGGKLRLCVGTNGRGCACECVRVRVYMYINIYKCIYVCVCVYVCMHVGVCVCAHTQVCIRYVSLFYYDLLVSLVFISLFLFTFALLYCFSFSCHVVYYDSSPFSLCTPLSCLLLLQFDSAPLSSIPLLSYTYY